MFDANRLFNCFPTVGRATLFSEGRLLDLPAGTTLIDRRGPAQYVYFLNSGIASTVVSMRGGDCVEIGMVGNKGIVGSTSLLGLSSLQSECFMWMQGTALRIPLATMKRCFEEVFEVRSLVSAFLQSEILVSAQLSACNKLHMTSARLARWLLMSSDRAQSGALQVTQEFLSQMLGA